MDFLSFLHAAKAVEQSGWSIKQYIKATNILFIIQHSKLFKYKKCMAIRIELSKYSSMNSLTAYDDEEGGGDTVVVGLNLIMSVQGVSNKQRPMGQKEAKQKAKNDSKFVDILNGPSDATRILEALERKN